MHSLLLNLPHMQIAAVSNQTEVKLDELSNERPLLIFVHGYLDNANSFLPLIPLFPEYQCIAIDLAGHGHSSHRPEGAQYHLVDYAYDLYQLIKSQGFSHVVLIGHSLGGIVSAIYAATQPKELIAFIAIESIGPLSQTETSTSEQLLACFTSRDKALGAIKQPSSMQLLVKARCAMSDLSAAHAEMILTRNVKLVHKRDKTTQLTWLTDKQLRTQSPFRMTESQAINILDNIECSRGLIIGKSGFPKIRRFLDQRASQFKNVEIAEIAGGHHVHMDSPNIVASQIQKWLNTYTK